jgi:hypothetical protein
MALTFLLKVKGLTQIFEQASGRVARFFLVQHTKTGKICQITIKYTKRPLHIPNGHKIYQHLPLKDPSKFIKICIFGLKIYHLATLPRGILFTF